MIKPIFFSLLFFLVANSSTSLAQSSASLEEACYGNIELGNYLFSVVSGGPVQDEDSFSESERTELIAVVNHPDLAGNSVQEKIRAVLEACISGDVLQERNSAMLNQ